MFFKQLGNFKPLLSAEQYLILQKFIKKVHEATTSLADIDVLEFVHEFLVKIFNESYSLTEEVSSVLKQVVLVSYLSKDTVGI
jgi:predicted neutral ceramidase superfamily lipid hydrolase